VKFKRKGEPCDVPVLGLVDVQPGDVVEATGPVADSLKSQHDAWEPVPSTKKEN
jgi:hypothetical protein